VYSLPTEAEWEYAARAGTTTAYSSGESTNGIEGDTGGILFPVRIDSPYFPENWVGRYKPNEFGLFDMHGGVSEWVEDIWKDNYEGLAADGSANTKLGDASQRIYRGGSYGADPYEARSPRRLSAPPDEGSSNRGFRIVARPEGNGFEKGYLPGKTIRF
jgi:formylglycine-generating enzyme required for sulfatase activity